MDSTSQETLNCYRKEAQEIFLKIENLGEEVLFLSIDVKNKSVFYLGSSVGEGFILERLDVLESFFSYCYDKYDTHQDVDPTQNQTQLGIVSPKKTMTLSSTARLNSSPSTTLDKSASESPITKNKDGYVTSTLKGDNCEYGETSSAANILTDLLTVACGEGGGIAYTAMENDGGQTPINDQISGIADNSKQISGFDHNNDIVTSQKAIVNGQVPVGEQISYISDGENGGALGAIVDGQTPVGEQISYISDGENGGALGAIVDGQTPVGEQISYISDGENGGALGAIVDGQAPVVIGMSGFDDNEDDGDKNDGCEVSTNQNEEQVKVSNQNGEQTQIANQNEEQKQATNHIDTSTANQNESQRRSLRQSKRNTKYDIFSNEQIKNKPKEGLQKRKTFEKRIYKCDLCGMQLRGNCGYQHHLRQSHLHLQCKCEECGETYPNEGLLKCHMDNVHSDRKYTCDTCGKVSTTKSGLALHKKVHDVETNYYIDKKIYQCDFCGRKVQGRIGFENHRKSHTGEKIQCDKCDKGFPNYGLLKMHNYYSHSERETLVCHLCGKTLTTKSGYTTHMKNHKKGLFDEENFTCKVCNKKFRLKNGLTMHMKKHTNPDDHCKCDLCGKTFKMNSYLITHKMSTHKMADRKYKCTYCDKTFWQRYTYLEHMTGHTGEEAYSCDICGKKFVHKGHMTSHRRLHSDPTHECNICGRKFTTLSYLQMHMEIHGSTGEVHICEVCGKKAPSLRILHQHKRIHTKTLHKCTHCDKIFKLKRSLKLHTICHHGDGSKPHVCEVCGKAFALKRYLRGHQAIHTDTKPFPCDLCDSAFVIKTKLRKHRLEVHHTK